MILLLILALFLLFYFGIVKKAKPHDPLAGEPDYGFHTKGFQPTIDVEVIKE
jgi:hypothetical protein